MFDEVENKFRRKFSSAYLSTLFSSDSESDTVHRDLANTKNNMNVSQTRLSNMQATTSIMPTFPSTRGSGGRRDSSFSIGKEQNEIQGSNNTAKSFDKSAEMHEEFI